MGTFGMSFFGAIIPGIHPDSTNAMILNLLLGKGSSPIAWLVRLGVGFTFTLLYHWLWENTNYEPTFLMGIVLGSINGIIGIMIAIALIFIGQCHVPNKYFRNVMIAHLIFGTIAVFGFNIMHK